MSPSEFDTLSYLLLGSFILIAAVLGARSTYTAGRSEGYRAGFEASSSFHRPQSDAPEFW